MNSRLDEDNFVASALPAFFSEAQEQIAALEDLLLQLETVPDDRELLGALFRCAHTIKGSAGMFGLDEVVAFTHHIESLLDKLRTGELALTPSISTLLLESNDQVRELVEAAQNPNAANLHSGSLRQTIVERLNEAAGTGSAPTSPTEPARSAAAADAATDSRQWHVRACFGQETFRNGMDPLTVLGYLRGLGKVTQVACDLKAIPTLDQIHSESCHIAVDFDLETVATRAEIEAAFSFVRDDCELLLTQPTIAAAAADSVRLIEAMPDHPRLGEILVQAGAITPGQLATGLTQQAVANPSPVAPPTPLGEILQASTGLHPTVVKAALAKQTRQREGNTGSSAVSSSNNAGEDNRFIRVEARRLDEVINLLGELVTASAGGLLLARQSKQRGLREANQQISRLVEDVRNGTLQLRMVPVGETFARFRRVVRDTAAELGKEVTLEILGGDTELDKSVVERIADPLMHLVRNALDHGLETPDCREHSGKSRQGKLTLSACHESGNVLIRIQDDGQGIQRDKVLQRAWDRGLVENGVVPSDGDILKLIFEPGFSTAEKVTNLSGRGVGMDVVRRNIEALRGSVTLHSEPGAGSCIEIRVPLTLAIIEGFLVSVGNSKFIFPQDAVVEVIERKPCSEPTDERGRTVMELRGQVLPVVSLRALYGLPPAAPERCSVVVIKAGGQRCGVMVDQLMGQHQTVIKPLARMFRSLRGMSGSSILGNGEVALIFDVMSLTQLAAEPLGPLHRAATDVATPARHSNLTEEGL